MEQAAQNPLTGAPERLDQASFIVLAQIRNARAGDLGAFKELMDSAYGKVVDKSSVLIDAEVKTEEHRPRTRAEIREHLKGKGFDVDTRTFIK